MRFNVVSKLDPSIRLNSYPIEISRVAIEEGHEVYYIDNNNMRETGLDIVTEHSLHEAIIINGTLVIRPSERRREALTQTVVLTNGNIKMPSIVHLDGPPYIRELSPVITRMILDTDINIIDSISVTSVQLTGHIDGTDTTVTSSVKVTDGMVNQVVDHGQNIYGMCVKVPINDNDERTASVIFNKRRQKLSVFETTSKEVQKRNNGHISSITIDVTFDSRYISAVEAANKRTLASETKIFGNWVCVKID